MTLTSSRTLAVQVACLSVWPLFLFAGAPDPAANLNACKSRWATCDRARLTLTEQTELARADHARNVTDCRNGFVACLDEMDDVLRERFRAKTEDRERAEP